MDWLQKEIYSGCSGTWSVRERARENGEEALKTYKPQIHAKISFNTITCFVCLWYTTTAAAAPLAETWNALNKTYYIFYEGQINTSVLLLVIKYIFILNCSPHKPKHRDSC